jgi:lipopolysaccharide export system protein LptA
VILRHFCISAVIFLAHNTVPGEQPSDKLWIKNADSFEYRRYRNEETRHLTGNVQIEYDSVNIFTDEMYDYLRRSRVDFIGNVRAHYQTKRLFADKAIYHKNRRLLICTALPDSLVRLVDPDERMTVTGRRLIYHESSDSAVMKEEPVLIDVDSAGSDTLRIISNTMDYSGKRRTATAIGDVVIFKRDLKATCNRAIYYRDQERISLLDSPVVITSESHLTGDEIEMILREGRLDTLKVLENGHGIYTEFQKDSSEKISELFGDTIHSLFRNDSLQKAHVINNARGQYFFKSEPEKLNTLTGDRIHLFFKNNEVEHIVVKDQATSVYYFEEDGKNEGKNNASGDMIFIDFKEGHVSYVRIKGGVQGNYIFHD